MRLKTICFSISFILFCSIIMTSCSNTASFENMVREGEYIKAINLYNDKISGNAKKELEASGFLTTFISDNLKQYAEGKIENKEVESNIKTVSEIDAVLEIIYEYLEESIKSYEIIKVSKENFSLGMAALNSDDFSQALDHLKRVNQTDIENYDKVQETIKAAQQSLKELALSTSNEFIVNGEYEKAIEVATNAKEYIDNMNDSDLENIISTAYTLRSEKTINEFLEVNDIPSAITAFDTFQNNPYFKASPELITEIGNYRSAYREEIIDLSIEKYLSDGYEEAINVIKQNLLAFNDDEKLNELIELYYSCAPIGVETFPIVDSSNDVNEFPFDTGEQKDINENSYIGYFRLMSYRHNTFKTFNLNGQYTNFSGTFFAAQDMESDATITFRIYADDIKVYESSLLKKNSDAVQFDIDITNVKKLKVESYSWYTIPPFAEYPSVILTGASVYRKLSSTELEIFRKK